MQLPRTPLPPPLPQPPPPPTLSRILQTHRTHNTPQLKLYVYWKKLPKCSHITTQLPRTTLDSSPSPPVYPLSRPPSLSYRHAAPPHHARGYYHPRI